VRRLDRTYRQRDPIPWPGAVLPSDAIHAVSNPTELQAPK